MKGNFIKYRNDRRHKFVVLLLTGHFWSTCLAFASFSLPRYHKAQHLFASSIIGIDDDGPFENVAAAVIVPGFLTGADEFEPLCKALTAKGIPAVAVPMPNWHWLPCLGGRSVRPILERIDFTVQHLIAHYEEQSETSTAPPQIPKYDYSLWDCWMDFRRNPGGVAQVGGSSSVEDYPVVEPRGRFPPPKNLRAADESKPRKKIALIGHR